MKNKTKSRVICNSWQEAAIGLSQKLSMMECKVCNIATTLKIQWNIMKAVKFL